jgi:uncharacterized protein YndB with AHSA1/START domain
MWINIGIVIVVAIVALGIAISSRPDAFSVQRSATIAGPPGAVFGYLNDFHRWPQWSPWEKLDPNMQRTHSGAPSGIGAKYAWSGNSKAGEGSMTIMESKPSERIVVDLNFIKPFKSSNVTEFVLKPVAQGTQVTWTMTGKHNTATKAFSLVADMDKLVGKDFEQGLANLKVAAEADASRGATL